MSAGVMPKLQKQEPWELIQAMAAAQDAYTRDVMENNLRREMQNKAEAGTNARMERAHQLGLDKISRELEIKEPYAEKEAARTWGYREKELGTLNENARRSIQEQGVENRKTHGENLRTDFGLQLEYAPKLRELEREKETETDARVLRRGQAEGEQKLQLDKRRQEEITEPAADRASKKQTELFEQQTGISYQDWLKKRQQMQTDKDTESANKPEQLRKEGLATNEVLEDRAKRLSPIKIEQDRAKQDAITGRQLSLAELRAQGMVARDQARQQGQMAIEQFKQGKMDNRKQLEIDSKLQSKGQAELAPGIVLRDLDSPNAMLTADDYKDKSKYKFLNRWTDPVKKRTYEVYQQTGGATDPRIPNSQLQRPSVRSRTVDPQDPRLLDPQQPPPPPPPVESQTPTPAIEQGMRGDTPTAPSTDWLRPLPPTGRDRRGALDTGSLIQTASLSPDDSGITVAPKSGTPEREASGIGESFDQARKVSAPVTTSGPGGGGKWLRTHAQLPAKWQDPVERAAQRYNISPDLIAATAYQESSWNPNAVGPPTRYGRAVGIGQFIPGTAAANGLTDRRDPIASFQAMGKELRKLANRSEGNIGLALLGYNWGPANIQKYIRTGRAPSQTEGYVKRITGIPLRAWRAAYLNKGKADDRTETSGMASDLPENAPLPPQRDQFLVDL